jgi:hypothetical protein
MKALSCCLTLLALAIGGLPADVQPLANGTHYSDQHDVTLSGSDYEEIAIAMAKLPKLAVRRGKPCLPQWKPGFRVSSTCRRSTSIPE